MTPDKIKSFATYTDTLSATLAAADRRMIVKHSAIRLPAAGARRCRTMTYVLRPAASTLGCVNPRRPQPDVPQSEQTSTSPSPDRHPDQDELPQGADADSLTVVSACLVMTPLNSEACEIAAVPVSLNSSRRPEKSNSATLF